MLGNLSVTVSICMHLKCNFSLVWGEGTTSAKSLSASPCRCEPRICALNESVTLQFRKLCDDSVNQFAGRRRGVDSKRADYQPNATVTKELSNAVQFKRRSAQPVYMPDNQFVTLDQAVNEVIEKGADLGSRLYFLNNILSLNAR